MNCREERAAFEKRTDAGCCDEECKEWIDCVYDGATSNDVCIVKYKNFGDCCDSNLDTLAKKPSIQLAAVLKKNWTDSLKDKNYYIDKWY